MPLVTGGEGCVAVFSGTICGWLETGGGIIGDTAGGGRPLGVETGGGGVSLDEAIGGIFNSPGAAFGFAPGVTGGGRDANDLDGVASGASFVRGGGPGGGGGLTGGALREREAGGGAGDFPCPND